MAPHRVPPRASAASFWAAGACENASRTTAVVMGVTMRASTMPAMKVEPAKLEVVVLKIGMKARWVESQRLSGRTRGVRYMRPQIPKITLGTAARRSTMEVNAPLTDRGAYSVMNRAAPTETGTAITMATMDI